LETVTILYKLTRGIDDRIEPILLDIIGNKIHPFQFIFFSYISVTGTGLCKFFEKIRGYMKIRYDEVKKTGVLFLALTGITVSEFEKLLPIFEKCLRDYVPEDHMKGKERKRRYGGGRKLKLSGIEDNLLFILFYFKLYPLQAVAGFLFGMSQSQTNCLIYRLSPILKKSSGILNRLPERIPQELKKVLTEEGEDEVVTDGTERKRQRPEDREKQRKFYRGKKKGHTLKNNVVVTTEGRKVKYLSGTYEGRKHDKKICDEENPLFPKGIVLNQDTGFQGYKPEGVIVRQPKKKPRGGKLSPAEKNQNFIIAGVRIAAEHVISGIKRCRIVKDIFRNTKEKFDDLVMEIACGLHNFRTEQRAD
jgi:hypothetical protein